MTDISGRVCSSCEAGDHAKCEFTMRRQAGLCTCADDAHESGRVCSCAAQTEPHPMGQAPCLYVEPGRTSSPVPLPRYLGINLPSSLDGAYNRGWNACREAMLTGRDEFDRCTFCSYSAGHANDCPVSAPARTSVSDEDSA